MWTRRVIFGLNVVQVFGLVYVFIKKTFLYKTALFLVPNLTTVLPTVLLLLCCGITVVSIIIHLVASILGFNPSLLEIGIVLVSLGLVGIQVLSA